MSTVVAAFPLHGRGVDLAATTVQDFLLSWQFEPAPLLLLTLVGLLYGRGHWRLNGLRRRARSDSSSATARFIAGWLVLALGLLSPLHSYSGELFSVHMTQHLLLISVAVPLMMAANPLPAMLWGCSREARALAGRLLAPRSLIPRVLGWLTRPVLAWWIFTLTIWIWHQSWAYAAALEDDSLHYLQHLTFVLAAALFWWPIIGPAPHRSRLSYPARLLYVFAAWLPNSILGAGITFAPQVLYSYYAARPRHWGLDPLGDQQIAGLIMWIPGDLIFAAVMLLLLVALMDQEDRRATRAAAA